MKNILIISIAIMLCYCTSTKQKQDIQPPLKEPLQKTGFIAGCVYRGTTAIKNVEIQINTLHSKKDQRSTISMDDGSFLFENASPEEYDLVAIKDGYKKILIKSIPVKAGEVSFVKIRLMNEFTDVMQPPLHWEDAGVKFIPAETYQAANDWCD